MDSTQDPAPQDHRWVLLMNLNEPPHPHPRGLPARQAVIPLGPQDTPSQSLNSGFSCSTQRAHVNLSHGFCYHSILQLRHTKSTCLRCPPALGCWTTGERLPLCPPPSTCPSRAVGRHRSAAHVATEGCVCRISMRHCLHGLPST